MNLHSDTRPIKEIDRCNLESKKVFIQYPISKICNLRCPYCFHQEYFQGRPDSIKYADNLGFTQDQFKLWMETHIYPNFNEVVIHFAGGEPFFKNNKIEIWETKTNYLRPEVKIDLLTNGMFNFKEISSKFGEVLGSSNIYRLGFTFHRKVLTQKNKDIFHDNVLNMKNLGIPVYVKELYHKDNIIDILKNKIYWENLNIPFKIQDVQNLDGSPQDYTPRDLSLISDEYKHQGNYCSCWQDWRSISIRGYDIGAGNVIACWLDPKIIGNIAENKLNLNFHVEINNTLGRRNVIGGNFSYSKDGTYDRDRKSCEH